MSYKEVAALTTDTTYFMLIEQSDEFVIEPPILADSATVNIGEPVVTIGNPPLICQEH